MVGRANGTASRDLSDRDGRTLDERSGTAPFVAQGLRYVFPDHWSFLLGEIALYCFIVLVGTGMYLTLFFDPSTAQTVYHGSYAPLQGQHDARPTARPCTSRSTSRRAS